MLTFDHSKRPPKGGCFCTTPCLTPCRIAVTDRAVVEVRGVRGWIRYPVPARSCACVRVCAHLRKLEITPLTPLTPGAMGITTDFRRGCSGGSGGETLNNGMFLSLQSQLVWRFALHYVGFHQKASSSSSCPTSGSTRSSFHCADFDTSRADFTIFMPS